jgi:hypothetical protein
LFQENKSFGASTICIHPLMYVKLCREQLQMDIHYPFANSEKELGRRMQQTLFACGSPMRGKRSMMNHELTGEVALQPVEAP